MSREEWPARRIRISSEIPPPVRSEPKVFRREWNVRRVYPMKADVMGRRRTLAGNSADILREFDSSGAKSGVDQE